MTVVFKMLPIESLYPDPSQPRKSGLADEDLIEVADSIASRGILQNLRVTADEKGKFMIVCGERRFRAALKAGLSEVPALIDEDLSEADRLEVQLAENILRRDLSITERANAFARFAKIHPDHKTAAKRLGISNGHLSNLLELTNLAPEVAALYDSKVTKDATTLVLANQLIRRSPERARVVLERAKSDGKLSRKAITAELAPYRRRKRKDNTESAPTPETVVDPAAAAGMHNDDRPVVKAPSMRKLKLVCSALRLDISTDPGVIIEQLVDQFLANTTPMLSAA